MRRAGGLTALRASMNSEDPTQADTEAVTEVDPEAVTEADAVAGEHWPVSVKGVLGWDGRTVVLRNHRGEWELPGGRLERTDASPQDALRREITEELGFEAEIGPLIDSWIYDVEGKRVLILTYSCTASRPASLRHSDEHTEVGLFSPVELRSEAIPSGYLRSINEVLGC